MPAHAEPEARRFEREVAALLEAEGYACELGSYVADGGVDVFASRGGERLAVQVKMYGSGRVINRRQIFELYGAMRFHDCTGAVIATNGRLQPDAADAARKLGVRVMDTRRSPRVTARSDRAPAARSDQPSFATVWERRVMPLAGQTLRREDGSTNRVVDVDWGGLTRVTSNGNRSHIPIEIFRWAIDRVLAGETVTRAEINEQFEGRASSGIVLVLAQIPEFVVAGRPLSVSLRRSR